MICRRRHPAKAATDPHGRHGHGIGWQRGEQYHLAVQRHDGTHRARSHVARPAMRLPDPQAALRPLHSRSRLARCAAADPELRAWPSCCAGIPARSHHSIAYSLGWTQHSTGPQMIRAWRSSSSSWETSDGRAAEFTHCGVMPASRDRRTFRCSSTCSRATCRNPPCATLPRWRIYKTLPIAQAPTECGTTVCWANLAKFAVSLLKAWYGTAATPQNEFGYQWLPRVDDNSSEMSFFARMDEGDVKGLFVMGQNPAAGGPNGRLHHPAMRGLDWLVVIDLFRNRDCQLLVSDPGGRPRHHSRPRSFSFPRRRSSRKTGSFTNTERMIQWHDKAVDPWETAVRTRGFLTISGSASRSSTRIPSSSAIGRCNISPGTTNPIASAPEDDSCLHADRRRTRRQEGTTGDQRLPSERETAAASGTGRAGERRINGLRVLALLRGVSRGIDEPGSIARQPRGCGFRVWRLGMGVARKSSRHVQPGVG